MIKGYITRVILLGLAFAVRALSLTAQGLWRDEVDQWRFAMQPLHEQVRNFGRVGWNGPLYSPLLRGWIALAGDTPFAMRMLSLLWGVLAVALIYVLGRRVLGRRAAVAAALLMALAPYMVWYAQEIKMYTLVVALVLLALYALDRAAGRRAAPPQSAAPPPTLGWWGVVWAATSLAMYTHILAALLIPVLVLWFLLHPRRYAGAWLRGLVVLAALTLPYLPLLRWHLPAVLEARETGYPRFTLGQMAAALLNGWSAGIYQGAWSAGTTTVAIIVVFGLVALLGLGALLVARRFSTVGSLLVWLGFPLLVVWGVSLRVPLFTDRYLIWSAPAFYLLAGAGSAAARRLVGRLGWLILIPLVVIDVHGLNSQVVHPIKPDFAAAAAYIAEHRGADARGPALLLFQIPHNHHVFAFYADAPLDPWAEAPYTNWRHADGSYQVDTAYVGHEMRRLLMNHARVWLVYSEPALWDERQLVKGWLDENYVRVDVARFPGVSLYAFERPRE